MNKSILSLFLAAGLSMGADWAVVTSPSSPIATISKGDLKRVFTGKKSNLDGVKAVPFMLAESNPAAVSFLKDVLGMSPEEYKKFWMDAQVKGEGTAPALQKTSAAAILVSADIPGAIAVVEKSAVKGSVKEIAVK
ncbi:MAG TPA: hypothetical protein PKO15_09005 [Fibrobacteria bacterium]|nr:hypothetical protein [Fibrobacteria bacterium]HOX53111.1 hypothetical protein [Fibrobacteria bacterium]